MTFTDILENEYGKEQSFHLIGRQKFDDMERYRAMSEDEKKQVNVISGHLSHLLEPDIPLKVRYVTFLRNPIDQFISSYYYILQTPHNPHHEAVKKLKDMQEYLDWQIKKEHDSLYARYLGDAVKYHAREHGVHVNAQNPKEGRALLDKAQKRLNEIEFVFITEKFDEAILVLHKALKWPKRPYYTKLNTSKRKELPDEKLIARIKEVHKYDFILYEEAKNRHDELVDKFLGNFTKQKIEQFRTINNLRSRLKKIIKK